MWCSQCQADVATEISADGKRLLCTICGEEVRKVYAPSEHPETKSARELLERWTKSELQVSLHDLHTMTPAATDEPARPLPPQESAPGIAAHEEDPVDEPTDAGVDLLPSPRIHSEAPAAPETRPVRRIHRGGRVSPQREPQSSSAQDHEMPNRNWRVDAAHQEPARKAPPPPASRHPFREAMEEAVAAAPPLQLRDDLAHESTPPPHFDLHQFAVAGRRPGRHESIFGQLLAYLGVGMLTIGTVLVVWGYFGGPNVARYQSTGWLISTAGQMLLFLGVVTLVSGGMQQTTHEVTERVELLGNRMLRIEQSTQELLKGPYFAREGSPRRSAVHDDSGDAP